nr:MAG TPA: hypothetical protein [Caudoviricetes sp.]
MRLKRLIHKLSYFSTLLSTLFFIVWTTGADTPINFELWESVWLLSIVAIILSTITNQITTIKNSKYNL